MIRYIQLNESNIFKIGNRVVALRDIDGKIKASMSGTIIDVDIIDDDDDDDDDGELSRGQICVEWDDHISGHNGNGVKRGIDGHCWWVNPDTVKVEETEKNVPVKIRWYKNGKLNESDSSDIKINVDGKNYIVDRLIDNLTLVVRKRKAKSLRIKGINGYVNKETFTRKGKYYDTHLELTLTNKDVIIGDYSSRINNICIKVNDETIYDIDNRSFDNEVLIDKIVGEYIKYLKSNKYRVNESNIETEFQYKIEKYDYDDITKYKLFKNDKEIGYFQIRPPFPSTKSYLYRYVSAEEYDKKFKNKKIVSLEYIKSYRSGRGTGTIIMKDLIKISNELGFDMIILKAFSDDSKKQDRLVSFYERFGFKILFDERGKVSKYTVPDIIMCLELNDKVNEASSYSETDTSLNISYLIDQAEERDRIYHVGAKSTVENTLRGLIGKKTITAEIIHTDEDGDQITYVHTFQVKSFHYDDGYLVFVSRGGDEFLINTYVNIIIHDNEDQLKKKIEKPKEQIRWYNNGKLE